MSTTELESTTPSESDLQDKVPDGSADTVATPSARSEVSPTEESAMEENITEPSDESQEGLKTPSSSRSSSFRPKSESSTIKYEQTPFTDFSIQVKELCHTLWPSSPKENPVQRLLGGPRLFGVFHGKRLGRFLAPASPPKAFDIERMLGGTFNRIIGIKIIGSEGEDPISLILRVSRRPWDSRPDREVATLEYLRRQTKIPVPHIKAFDFTDENPLKSPYIVQNRISGVSLQNACQGLSHKQWCTLAKEVATTIIELRKLTNSTPGLVESTTRNDGIQHFTVCPFDIRRPHDREWKKGQTNSLTLEADNAYALQWYVKDTFHFFVTQFGRWMAEELQCNPISILYKNQWQQLKDVVSAMNRLGILRDSRNVFTHMDLAPRNIMVELGPDDFIKITGILDWDSALFAPDFVSCRPPWWLWQDEKFPEDAMEDELNACEEPDDPELLEVKTIFEEIMGDEYIRFAYQPQFLLARRLFKIALHGNYSSETMIEIDEIMKDWDAFYKAEVEDYVSESSFDSANYAHGEKDEVGADPETQ